MAFIPISVENYIKMYLLNNPKDDSKEVKAQIEQAIADFNAGKKCTCGEDIWVVGSASVGNMCFTCITGDDFPTDDYEIDSVLENKLNNDSSSELEEFFPEHISGYFNDDGTPIDINTMRMPGLCTICINNDDPDQEILCNLTRLDYNPDEEFICYAFIKK